MICAKTQLLLPKFVKISREGPHDIGGKSIFPQSGHLVKYGSVGLLHFPAIYSSKLNKKKLKIIM